MNVRRCRHAVPLAAVTALDDLRQPREWSASVTVGARQQCCPATLTGPSGRQATVVTVWIVPNGRDFAHFVTAFPG
jgi:hypothetical protein